MKVCVLGSGSRGNCTYIATRQGAVLVDLGFGGRSLKKRLEQSNLDPETIRAVLLTHGHADHTRGAVSFAVRHGVPVFMNEGTREEVARLEPPGPHELFQTGTSFRIAGLDIESFPVPHDAADPVGFRFRAQGIQGSLVTDLGQLTPLVVEKLSGCDWLILESNHDEELLRVGPYPWPVKQRVLSSRGHLSNQSLSHFFSSHFDRRAVHLFLAHLSQKNNHPQIAIASALKALSRPFPLLSGSCRLHLTHQHKPSIVLSL